MVGKKVRAVKDISYLVSADRCRSSDEDKRKQVVKGTVGVVVHEYDDGSLVVEFGRVDVMCASDAVELI